MKTLRLALVIFLACASMACAPLRSNVRFQGMGAANPTRDREISEAIDDDRKPGPDSVTVLVDTIPDGIDLSTGVMRVAQGYQHQILGKVMLTANVHVSLIALMGFPDYATTWRKPYCYPQTILNYATLMLWSLVVPTSYVCYGKVGIDEEDAVATLKRSGAAAGGDTVLASYLRLYDRIYAVSGVILKLDPRVKMSMKTGAAPDQQSSPAGGVPSTSL